MDQVALNTGEMQGGGRTLKKACKNCGTENIFIVPQYEIVNSYGLSMLVFPHPEPQYCEKCNRPYQMILANVDAIGITFMPLKEQKGKIITPPTGLIV